MIIHIEIDTEKTLSPEDKAILRAVGYMDEGDAAPAAKAPAKKAAAKKAAAAPPPKDESPAPSTVKGEVVEEPDEATQALTDAAVARASELLSGGQRDRVMAALKDAGAPKVSAIPADKVEAFLAALTD
jgi:hypothetical protein